mmetsp:Transcript_139893/g.447405  ORF Transcript_139893/g.447405 Transcript_139893/m.447405 type:complete len:467 (-) Transcript_139893:12-1412(-)
MAAVGRSPRARLRRHRACRMTSLCASAASAVAPVSRPLGLLWVVLAGPVVRAASAIVEAAPPKSDKWSIPHDIFTFWEGPRPELVERTLTTWQRFARGWTIHVVNKGNLADFLNLQALPPGWEALNVLQLSDLVRLEVVAAHGGVWLDATAALATPIELWVPESSDGGTLIGFDLDFALLKAKEVSPSAVDWAEHFHANGSLREIALADDGFARASARVFESWGFAAPRSSRALTLWRDEFRRAVSHPGGTAAYCSRLVEEPSSGEFLHPGLRRWLPYLTIHATMARARHSHRDALVHTYPAESLAFQHLDYVLSWPIVWLQGTHNFILDGTGGAMLALGRGPAEAPPAPQLGLLLKLRNLDRTAYRCLVAYGAYQSESPLASVFALPPLPRVWPARVMRYLAAFEARFGPTDDKFLVCLFAAIRGGVGACFFFVRMFCDYLSLWILIAVGMSAAAVARYRHQKLL